MSEPNNQALIAALKRLRENNVLLNKHRKLTAEAAAAITASLARIDHARRPVRSRRVMTPHIFRQLSSPSENN